MRDVDKMKMSVDMCALLRASVKQRGIRRREDKALCDASMRRELLDVQGAARNGPVHLLVTRGKRKTYVTVLDWTAEKDTLGVGRKAQMSLGLNISNENENENEMETSNSDSDQVHNDVHNDNVNHHVCVKNQEGDMEEGGGEKEEETMRVRVDYVILPKGKSAVLRPRKKSFFDVFDEPKQALEASLVACATLAEGDVLQCGNELVDVVRVEKEDDEGEGEGSRGSAIEWNDGMPRGISIVETDLEVEIVPSLEEEEEAGRIDAARQATIQKMDTLRAMLDTLCRANEDDVDMQDASERIGEEQQQQQEEEGEEEAKNGVAIALRLPRSGTRVVRRFFASSPASSLFAWADVCGAKRELRQLNAESVRASRAAALSVARGELDTAETALRARVSSSGAAIEALDALRERVDVVIRTLETAVQRENQSDVSLRESGGMSAPRLASSTATTIDEYALVAPGGVSVCRGEQRSLGELGILGASLMVRAI